MKPGRQSWKRFAAFQEHSMSSFDCGVDWSEFHDWSFRMSQLSEKVGTVSISDPMEEGQFQHVHATGGKVNGHLCAGCMRQSFYTWMTHLHMPHPNHHTTAYAAYAQFTAGALGGGTATYVTHWLDTVKVKMQTFPDVHKSSIASLRNILRDEGVKGLYQGASPAVIGHMSKTAIVFMSYGLCEESIRKLTGCSKVEDLTIWHHAGSGAMTGVVASFILCPMELIKCRLQALHSSNAPRDGLPSKLSPLTLIRTTLKSHGLRGLYRGLPGIWTKEVPGSFIYFGSYEGAKSVLRHFNECPQLNGKPHALCPSGARAVFLSGMFAGLCYCVTHPIESVKTRVQVMSAVKETRGFFHAFVQIIKTEGIKPLLSGLTPSLVRACLYSGIQFVTFETAKEYFMRDD